MVIVTGANGFIGSAILWQLNLLKIPVVAVTDLIPPAERPELLQAKKFDQFLGIDELWSFLNSDQAKQVKWIIHMGANSSTTEKDPQNLDRLNSGYTQRLIEVCSVKAINLIYASSAATYGAGELGYSDELDSEQLVPLNLYGESKVKVDRWVKLQTKLPPKWFGLRFFNVYGPNEYHKGPMASLVYKAYHQVKMTGELSLFRSHKPEFKDGEQMRDFVYVKDITRWIVELMQSENVPNGIYNMGYGKAETWNSLASAVFAALDKKINIKYIDMPENIRNQYQYFTEASMTKFLSTGMSNPQWSIQKGVGDYVKNFLENDESLL